MADNWHPYRDTPTWRLIYRGLSISGGADTVSVTDGAYTATVASDDAGAAGHVQIVKLAIATDGSATAIPADANGLLVKSATAANLNMTEASAANALTALQLIDDVVHVDDTATHATGTTKGVLIMGAAVPTDTAVSANDIGAVGMSLDRRLYVEAVGTIAHDTAIAGNPVRIGATAETSLKGITPVSDADITNLYADSDGLQIIKLNTTGADLISERVSNTDGASTAFTNFSAVASTYNYVTSITVFRTDADTALAYVDIRDGTAGSIKWSMPLPPGGGSTVSSATPLFKSSAATALAYDVSSALTTVYISMSGFQSKV